MSKENIILYDDPSIVRKVNMVDDAGKVISVGYLSNDNFFYNDESHARYRSCTHKTCECGKPMNKYYTKCESCRYKNSVKRYYELPFEEWDGVTPLVMDDSNECFFSYDDIVDYLDNFDDEIKSEDLRLVICEPNKMKQVSSDYWEDIFPEGMERLPEEVEKALEALNNVIREAKPISWRPGKKRTTVEIAID